MTSAETRGGRVRPVGTRDLGSGLRVWPPRETALPSPLRWDGLKQNQTNGPSRRPGGHCELLTKQSGTRVPKGLCPLAQDPRDCPSLRDAL